MKILLIDDSTLSRNFIKRALGDGYTYAEAQDGIQGLELFYLEKPDLVLLDLTMPGRNGIDVLKDLTKIDPQVRVVIATADVQDFSRQEAVELGALGFITKPFISETVQETVRKALEKTQ